MSNTMTDRHTEVHEEHAHPGPRRYIEIAIILGVFTTIEVILSYAGLQKALTTVLMVLLAIMKFALVAMWFMHLRFDNRLFTLMFAGGLALAVAVLSAVLTIQRVFFVS